MTWGAISRFTGGVSTMNSVSARLVRRRTFVAVAALLAVVLAAPDRSPAQPANRQIGLGEARSFHSMILNEDRELQIALPEGYARTAISYPVLYVLDGSSHLLHASATTRFLASAR